MFVGPGADVYEGMIVGENSRAEDMDVNISREKKLTNIARAHRDETVRLVPPSRAVARAGARVHRATDECVEVTPRPSGCAR